MQGQSAGSGAGVKGRDQSEGLGQGARSGFYCGLTVSVRITVRRIHVSQGLKVKHRKRRVRLGSV